MTSGPAGGGRVAAVVPAAGRGERLGPGRPKALRTVGGVPLLVHAVRSLAQARSVCLVVVAVPAGEVEPVRAMLAGVVPATASLRVVEGGATRQQSVGLALADLPADVDVVLVHDAARPFAPPELADEVVAAVRAGADAVVPGLPVADTVKAVDADGAVTRTVDRAPLRAVQTPQGFRRDVLVAVHEEAARTGAADLTDDAGLVERAGRDVLVVPGAEEAFKVTRPLDLLLAEAVLAQRRTGAVGGARAR